MEELIYKILNELYEMKEAFTQTPENHVYSSIQTDRRWLNSSEAAQYLGYTVDGLRKLKDVHLFLDVHYFKKSGKLIFDKYALDSWVMEDKIA